MPMEPSENPERHRETPEEREHRPTQQSPTPHSAVDADGEGAVEDNANRIAPSELVRLTADRFVARGRSGAVPLLNGGGHVPAHELTLTTLAAAFFENERVGVVRLVPERSSGWFGGSERLYVEPSGDDAPWPEYSWEATIPRLVDRLTAETGDGRVELSEVVYRLLAEDAPDPWLRAVDHVDEGLAARGLLDPARAEGGNQFADARYVTSDRTESILDDREPERLKQRLREVRMYSPDLWSLFEDEVERAVDERTVDETDGDSDRDEDREGDGVLVGGRE